MGLQVLIAYLVDRVAGDPSFIPHPVILLGKLIEALEKVAVRLAKTPGQLRVAGICIVLVTIGITYFTVSLVLLLLAMVHPLLAFAAGIWFISTTIAARGLAEVAGDIYNTLNKRRLATARDKVGMVVGRDSTYMGYGEVSRAVVETVAENTVDAVVAPVFYAFIAGPAGALTYRAVNTLDSMLGYREGNYLYLGWASARLDDVANYIPARLTGFFMILAAYITGRDFKGGCRSLFRDARKHPSPNAGIPESVMAGALGIRLGGLNYYFGQPSYRAEMGEENNCITPVHIISAVDLMILTSTVFTICGSLVFFLVT